MPRPTKKPSNLRCIHRLHQRPWRNPGRSAVSQSYTQLGHNNRASGFFRYIKDHPKDFFDKLEELAGAESLKPHIIPADERKALVTTITAALNQKTTAHAR